ncbi:MAG: histidine kinase, partial [Bacteroidaceae bacterium]|nr:histidine kinase [Bacteroidaceae bacterium]
MRRIISLLAVVLLLMLLGCGQTSKKPLRKTYVDSLKTRIDNLSSSDYENREKLSIKGMSFSKDSDDYYYFMTSLALSKMWRSDTRGVDSLLDLLKPYISQSHTSVKFNDVKARYFTIIGNMKSLNIDPLSALSYYKMALECLKKGSVERQAITLTLLSDGYIANSDFARGAACLRRALFLSDSLHNMDIKIQANDGLAKTYVGLRNFSEAEKYLKQGEKLLPYMRGRQKFFYYNTFGNFYYYKEDVQNTLRVFRMMNQQLDSIATNQFDKNLTWVNLADAYVKAGLIDSARIYQNKCRDFFVKTNNRLALYYLDTQNIAILLRQNKLKEVKKILDKKNGYKNIESDQQYIRDKYLLDYFTRVGDDHNALIYLKKITHVGDSVRTEVQRFATAETAYRYELDSKALKFQLSLSKSQEHLRSFELYLVIALFVIVLLILTFFSLSIYTHRKRQNQLKKENEHIMKLRMEELRNRVSPHFVFNVLSYEIYNRQQGKESTDIMKLVKLIRNGLEESENLCVPLSKELDFIDGYVELQSKGMDENFVYNMNIAGNVDIEKVLIPSMMIQIAVENAIKHGLRGLNREKRLDITIERVGNATHVMITDNGRGLNCDTPQSDGTGTGTRV